MKDVTHLMSVTVDSGVRYLPARAIPTPTTVSAELAAAIVKPSKPSMPTAPETMEEWRKLAEKLATEDMESISKLIRSTGVSYTSETMGGVRIFVVEPESISARNRERILLNTHGGGYCFAAGEAGLREAVLMACRAQIRVVAVDYRMPPEYPFPAALDDTVAVHREILKEQEPSNVGFFGASAGAGLASAVLLKLKELGLPLPGALALISPWTDLDKNGDTYFTNDGIDGVQWTYEGILAACARLYAGMHDMTNPLLSPIYGDLGGFPPTILTSGTRDLFLSCAVRMHRKLRAAGVRAELHVFEGLSHAQDILAVDSPESHDSFREYVRFFDENLSR